MWQYHMLSIPYVALRRLRAIGLVLSVELKLPIELRYDLRQHNRCLPMLHMCVAKLASVHCTSTRRSYPASNANRSRIDRQTQASYMHPGRKEELHLDSLASLRSGNRLGFFGSRSQELRQEAVRQLISIRWPDECWEPVLNTISADRAAWITPECTI